MAAPDTPTCGPRLGAFAPQHPGGDRLPYGRTSSAPNAVSPAQTNCACSPGASEMP
ncbi:hypothetical protein [Mycobacterium sp. ACS1612]|uniref:hypothetical protein n=1 Tax=Mycobacterium sp. ACS1612 TaxID=1834117 RepID=UPI0012E9D48F|nr:hypothetical protein [Mycobacterium sp. ACS1612]